MKFLLTLILTLFLGTPLFADDPAPCQCPNQFQLDLNTGTFRSTGQAPVAHDSHRSSNTNNSTLDLSVPNTETITHPSRGRITLNGTVDKEFYTVARGDVLWKIAYVFGVSVSTLSSVNALTNRNWIEPGQILTVRIADSVIASRRNTHNGNNNNIPTAVIPGITTPRATGNTSTTDPTAAVSIEEETRRAKAAADAVRAADEAHAAAGTTATPSTTTPNTPHQ